MAFSSPAKPEYLKTAPADLPRQFFSPAKLFSVLFSLRIICWITLREQWDVQSCHCHLTPATASDAVMLQGKKTELRMQIYGLFIQENLIF